MNGISVRKYPIKAKPDKTGKRNETLIRTSESSHKPTLATPLV